MYRSLLSVPSKNRYFKVLPSQTNHTVCDKIRGGSSSACRTRNFMLESMQSTATQSSIMVSQMLAPSTLLSEVESQGRTRVALPASWMRCGTSKGLFIQRQDLPSSPNEWKPWLLAAMGSRGQDTKQLDGIGGASSTTSKVAVVSRSNIPGIDIEYTFAQVGVGKDVVDFTGNCGNIASGVGPFAVEQGLFSAPIGLKSVRVFSSPSTVRANQFRLRFAY